jgi:hypothetical protein
MNFERQQGPQDEQESHAEDWQAKVERLQEAVCVLLTKNQTMRMSLLALSFREEASSGRADRPQLPAAAAVNPQ